MSFDSETGTIDFASLSAKASEMMDAAIAANESGEQAPETPSTEVKAETPPATPSGQGETAAKPAEAEKPAPKAQATPTELSDEALVKVVVDGEEQVLPWKEAKGKISGGLKFTRNMQQVAQERAAVQQEKDAIAALKAERDQLLAFTQNPNAMAEVLRRNFGAAITAPKAQPTVDPNEVATVGQAAALAQAQMQNVEARLTAMQQDFADRIAATTQEIEDRQQVQKHAIAINSTLGDIFTKNPVLNAIPNAEDLIRFQVAQMNPADEAAALEAFRTVAGGMVEDISKHFKATQKVAAVAQAKAKLESSGIEPPGGAAVQQQPTDFKKSDGQVDWDKVKKAAADYLAR